MKALIEVEPSKPLVLRDLKQKADEVFSLLDISPSTRQDYSYRIGSFLEFITEKGFNRNSFLEFKHSLGQRDDFTVATKNKYLASARVFLKELARSGAIPVDITLNVKSFRQTKKHKKEGLTEKEIALLAAKIKDLPDTPKNARLKVLFCLFALQGLRQIEVVRLNVEDLDLSSKLLFVQGKGSDDKELIYLQGQTVEALRNYIRLAKVGSGALFKSLGNRKSKRLTSRTIKLEFKSLFENLGINKTVHGFRHYFITHLLKSFSMGAVRKFSRHKSLDMLIVYDDEINLSEKKEEVFACFERIKIV